MRTHPGRRSRRRRVDFRTRGVASRPRVASLFADACRLHSSSDTLGARQRDLLPMSLPPLSVGSLNSSVSLSVRRKVARRFHRDVLLHEAVDAVNELSGLQPGQPTPAIQAQQTQCVNYLSMHQRIWRATIRSHRR